MQREHLCERRSFFWLCSIYRGQPLQDSSLWLSAPTLLKNEILCLSGSAERFQFGCSARSLCGCGPLHLLCIAAPLSGQVAAAAGEYPTWRISSSRWYRGPRKLIVDRSTGYSPWFQPWPRAHIHLHLPAIDDLKSTRASVPSLLIISFQHLGRRFNFVLPGSCRPNQASGSRVSRVGAERGTGSFCDKCLLRKVGQVVRLARRWALLRQSGRTKNQQGY